MTRRAIRSSHAYTTTRSKRQSVGVALAGVVIYFKPHWQVVDPICTILFSILICYSTLNVRMPLPHSCPLSSSSSNLMAQPPHEPP